MADEQTNGQGREGFDGPDFGIPGFDQAGVEREGAKSGATSGAKNGATSGATNGAGRVDDKSKPRSGATRTGDGDAGRSAGPGAGDPLRSTTEVDPAAALKPHAKRTDAPKTDMGGPEGPSATRPGAGPADATSDRASGTDGESAPDVADDPTVNPSADASSAEVIDATNDATNDAPVVETFRVESPDAATCGESTSGTSSDTSNREEKRGRADRKSGRQEAESNHQPDSSTIDFAIPTLRHFASFTRTPQTIEHYIVKALQENRRLDHMLIHGRPGSGTTVLARTIAREFGAERVVEIDAQEGVNGAKLRRALAHINRRGVLIIRHIELLDPECAHILGGYLKGTPIARESTPNDAIRMRWESMRDRQISQSAQSGPGAPQSQPRGPITPGGTVIGTALVPARLSYTLRKNFDQLIHLRSDPKALRHALCRALAIHRIRIAPDAFGRIERVLGSLIDGTEPLARAVLVRSQMEGAAVIDDPLMQSIIEEDLHSRLPDTQYAASLRQHLGGRKVKSASDDEVRRIDDETGWGPDATRSAITAMLRENRARRQQELPPMPF